MLLRRHAPYSGRGLVHAAWVGDLASMESHRRSQTQATTLTGPTSYVDVQNADEILTDNKATIDQASALVGPSITVQWTAPMRWAET